MIDRENNPIKAEREKAGMSLKELSIFVKCALPDGAGMECGRLTASKWVQQLIVEKIENAV